MSTSTAVAVRSEASPANVVSMPRQQVAHRASQAEELDYQWKLAGIMSHADLVPEHLRDRRADCFLVIRQARTWGMDEFQVAQESFVTRGKIGYSGKLIAAACRQRLGVDFQHAFHGKRGTPERRIVLADREITTDDGTGYREISGSIGEWQTKGKDGSVNSQWRSPSQADDMLYYRGVRQWMRRYAPEVVLGVLSDDEVEHIAADKPKAEPKTLAAETPPAKEEVDHDDGELVALILTSIDGCATTLELREVMDANKERVKMAKPASKKILRNAAEKKLTELKEAEAADAEESAV